MGSRPLPQTDPSQGPFLTVFAMFYAHRALLKKERGSAPPARLPIAKAKATPHAMPSNMPGIRCLVHRRIEGLPPMPPTPKTGGSKRCFAERESNFFIFRHRFFLTENHEILRCLEMPLKLAESWLICGYRFHQKDFVSQETSQHRRNETINFCSTCGHVSAFLFVKVRGFLHHLPSFTLYPFFVVAMEEVVGQSVRAVDTGLLCLGFEGIIEIGVHM